VDFIHIGIEFESQARPVKVLQCRTLPREQGESGLFQQVHLPFLDEPVIEAAHAAEKIAEFHECNQRREVFGFIRRVMERHNLTEIGREVPVPREQTSAFAVSESQEQLLGFVKRDAFLAR
jgi:hypothetical protein